MSKEQILPLETQSTEIVEKLKRLDVGLPIDPKDIPDFQGWVNFDGLRPWTKGFNFAAYLTNAGKVVLGLPFETPIKAVANGTVYYTIAKSSGEEKSTIWIAHENGDNRLVSGYYDIAVSLVTNGERVKKGDVIGTLFKPKSDKMGPLVRFHFELIELSDSTIKHVDLRNIDFSLGKYNMIPPNDPNFTIPGLAPTTPFEVAHFEEVDTGSPIGVFKSRTSIRSESAGRHKL